MQTPVRRTVDHDDVRATRTEAHRLWPGGVSDSLVKLLPTKVAELQISRETPLFLNMKLAKDVTKPLRIDFDDCFGCRGE